MDTSQQLVDRIDITVLKTFIKILGMKRRSNIYNRCDKLPRRALALNTNRIPIKQLQKKRVLKPSISEIIKNNTRFTIVPVKPLTGRRFNVHRRLTVNSLIIRSTGFTGSSRTVIPPNFNRINRISSFLISNKILLSMFQHSKRTVRMIGET